MINMTKIDYVINITGASYDIVRKALLDSDGDVDVAISYIREGKYDANIEPSRVYENEKEKESDSHGERKSSKDYVDDVIKYLDEILEALGGGLSHRAADYWWKIRAKLSYHFH